MNPLKEVYKLTPERVRYETSLQLHARGIQNVRHNFDAITSIDVGLDDWCNRLCFYCPVSTSPRRHSKQGTIMPVEVQLRLLKSLQRINYCGNLQPVHFNEPLLRAETSTFPFFERAKELVPRARLTLYTNGDLLPKYVDMVVRLGIDVVVGLHEPINQETINFLRSRAAKTIKILTVKDNRFRTDLFHRTSKIPSNRIYHPDSCPDYVLRKNNTMVISPLGDVVSCIQQDQAEGTIWGNINVRDVMDIWTQREFWQFREQRRLNQAVGMLAICHVCLGR